jgi:hypothetical protein
MKRIAILSLDKNIQIHTLKFFEKISQYSGESNNTISTSGGLINIDRTKIVNTTKQSLKQDLHNLKDKYDNVLIVKGDEQLGDVLCTIKFYKGMDSPYGDLETTSSNPLHILDNMISRQDYLAVNSLGYVKNKINKIEPNFHTRNGGIWVRCKELSTIYVSKTVLSYIDIQDLDYYNIV